MDVFYDHVSDRPAMLATMASRDAELAEQVIGHERLADVLYDHVLKDPEALDRMAETNRDLARRILGSLVTGGHWLHSRGSWRRS